MSPNEEMIALDRAAFVRMAHFSDEEAVAQHTIDVLGPAPDGSYLVEEWTNDDEDHGYPNEEASWYAVYPTLKATIKHCGVSRIGVSGVQVTVSLNGKRITDEIEYRAPNDPLVRIERFKQATNDILMDVSADPRDLLAAVLAAVQLLEGEDG